MRHPLALALAASLALTSCSGFASKVSRRFGGSATFDVELDRRLNQDFPLAVDFVVIYDKDLFAELKKLSAEEWFAQREQYQRDNEPQNLEITSREWVPPCVGCPQPAAEVVEYRIGAQAGIVFANYFNPGVHRMVVEPLAAFTLKLGETEAAVGPAEKLSRKDRKKQKKSEKQRRRNEKKAKKAAS